ncbi:dynamin family protein [Apiospora saccharicola]|uniref:Dynamin family protein n=1 Tax=Apiospora saccharicola TaxID=335842 RepID=A0ABR1UN00_9PEZI
MGRLVNDDERQDLAEQISQKTSGFIQSENHRDLLDIVDSLRSHGVSHYVDLPQIIVCGSQSSGKSSTLEAISGIAFPTSEGLCTRFATELILRRGDKPEIKIHIQPGASRSEEDRIKLSAFSEGATEQDDFAKIIESAKSVMRLGDGGDSKVFSTDVLRIESTSPNAPNLTLVDLPGLFGASDKNQIDPSGTRTLGLITKPDRIDQGSESERYYIELAQNGNVKLKLGWHVLRNKSHTTSNDTPQERDERESDFFSSSAWQVLEPSQLGVEALRDRLREALWNQILVELPEVKSEVQSGIKDCLNKLKQLGKSRSTPREKHHYLHKISSQLAVLVRASIDGVYADFFFESYPGQPDAFERRLRANVQKILAKYAEKMRVDGHALEIVETGLHPNRTSLSKHTWRTNYLKVVEELMEECRGRELPGTYNPLVVGDLFARQCKPWEAITTNLVEEVHEAAVTTFNKMVSGLCDQNTHGRLMKWLIQPSLHRLRKDVKAKLEELLLPHLSIHPITYNDYLTDTVQKIQDDRHSRNFDQLTLKIIPQTRDELSASPHNAVPLKALLMELEKGTCPNVREYSASLAADVAAAYYTVALKKFIDDVSVNAVEACLIQKLPDVLSPEVVWDLPDEQIERLGSEDDRTIAERSEVTKKLGILEQGLQDLDAFTARSGIRGV